MGRLDATRAERQRADRPLAAAEGFDEDRRDGDVDDRVPIADLMKCYVVERFAVHRALGLGEEGENSEGPVPRRRCQARPLQQMANIGIASMTVARCGDMKARPDHGRVPVADDVDADVIRRIQGRQYRLGGVGQIRPGVEDRGSEHVAGQAADRIEEHPHGTGLLLNNLTYRCLRGRGMSKVGPYSRVLARISQTP